MAEHSNIEWCDSTFNPWIGCTAISPGCANCYAADWAKRYGRDFAQRKRTAAWRAPKKWNAEAATFFAVHGRSRRVFCASLADVFDNQVPAEWRVDLFQLIADTPHLDWLLLTKRIGNARDMLNAVIDELSCGINTWDEMPWPNVWIGATVVDQAEADRDIPKLLEVPARVRFLSIEPMLGPVYVEDIPDPAGGICLKPLAGLRWVGDGQGRCTVRALEKRIDWVICGGESGPKARPASGDWYRSIRDQCAAAGVPFLFKQHGEWIDPRDLRRLPGGGMPGFGVFDSCRHDMGTDAVCVGKKAAGRLLDGVEHNGFPVVV